MRKGVKKEVIIINDQELKFTDFAQKCWQASGREKDLDWFITTNLKSLVVGWDRIKDGARDKHVETVQKQNSFWNTIKLLFKSMF